MPRFGRQDWCTPPEFLAAVERDLGPIRGDLACSEENNVLGLKSADFSRLPPFITEEENSLNTDWNLAIDAGRFGEEPGVLWCNPPYSDIEPWVAKAGQTAGSMPTGWSITILCPASLSTAWARRTVFGRRSAARVLTVFLVYPRLTFVGAAHPYPKDLMLLRYERQEEHGNRRTSFVSWDWPSGEMFGTQ